MKLILSITLAFVIQVASGFGFLIGYKRRTKRSIVSLVCMAAAVLIAFVLIKFVLLPVLKPIVPDIVSGMLEEEYLPLTAESACGVLLYVLSAGFVGLAVFFPLFGILRLLLLIPDCIVRHKIKKKETEKYRADMKHKIIGGAVGVLAGLLLVFPLAAAIAMPVGLCNTVSGILDDTGIELPDGIVTEIVSLLSSEEETGLSSELYSLLSRPFLNTFSDVEYKGEKESVSVLGDWLRKQAGLAGTVYDTLTGESGTDKDRLLRLLDCVSSSAAALRENVLVRNVLADLLENLKNLTDVELPYPQETLQKLADSLRADDGSFDKLVGSVKNTTSIAVQLSDGNVDSAAIAESISWLSENMDKESAETVKTLVSAALSGIAEGKTAEVLTNAFSTLCDRLASGEKISEEQAKKNAEALTKFYDIGTKVAGTDMNGRNVFDDVLPSAEELVTTICEAEVISGIVQDLAFDENGAPVANPLGERITLNDTDKQKLQEALDGYRSAHTETDPKTLDAVANLFGI